MAAAALSNQCDILLHSRHRLPFRPTIISSFPLTHLRITAIDPQREPVEEPEPSTSSPSQPKPQPQQKSASVQSAFAKAAAYRKSLQKSGPNSTSKATDVAENEQNSPSILLQDLSPGFASRSRREQEEEMARALRKEEESSAAASWKGGKAEEEQKGEEDMVEVEIITRDGVIKRKASKRPEEYYVETKERKRGKGVSSTDFLGLDFSEKKKYYSGSGKPAGLSAGFDPPPALPEVEIITRDGSKAGSEFSGDLYRPKVSTWGVFDRPSNISRTYGGGRVINPGQPLETEEEKKASEERWKQLLAAYHKKIGLDVDPEVKADCEKALKLGNESLGKGELQSAIQYYEKVMQKMPYQSEIYGTAALQLAVCLDSSARFQEARELYEKIANHPNVDVRRKTKQLLFGFKAMDALNVSATSNWDGTLYQKYFNAFTDGYNNLYRPKKEEIIADQDITAEQTYLYIGFLFFPLILFFLALLLKGK